MKNEDYLTFLDLATVTKLKHKIVDVIVQLQGDNLSTKEHAADQLLNVVKEMTLFERDLIQGIKIDQEEA